MAVIRLNDKGGKWRSVLKPAFKIAGSKTGANLGEYVSHFFL